MISMIAAMGRNRVIGKDNRLPWKLSADLAHFKRLTLGYTVVMGRKTFESIGRPLPSRKNVIVSRNNDYNADGCEVVGSLDELLERAACEEFFVIGGADIYSRFISYADRLYITFIDEEFDGDAFFPEIDPDVWSLVSKAKGERDEKNPYDYYFMEYVRAR